MLAKLLRKHTFLLCDFEPGELPCYVKVMPRHSVTNRKENTVHEYVGGHHAQAGQKGYLRIDWFPIVEYRKLGFQTCGLQDNILWLSTWWKISYYVQARCHWGGGGGALATKWHHKYKCSDENAFIDFLAPHSLSSSHTFYLVAPCLM